MPCILCWLFDKLQISLKVIDKDDKFTEEKIKLPFAENSAERIRIAALIEAKPNKSELERHNLKDCLARR